MFDSHKHATVAYSNNINRLGLNKGRFNKAELETYTPQDEARVRDKLTVIQKGFEDLLAVLPEDKCPKTRAHVSNFLVAGLTAFEYWLKHHHWLTLTL